MALLMLIVLVVFYISLIKRAWKFRRDFEGRTMLAMCFLVLTTLIVVACALVLRA